MPTITTNIDRATYEQAAALFAFRGKTVEDAIIELIQHAAYDEEPHYKQIIPNDMTQKAMQECEDILSGRVQVKAYTDVDEMFDDILNGNDDNDE